jgi:hypothetical protein
MTTKTLKELIEIEFERCETISQFKSGVFRLIDVYERAASPKFPTDLQKPQWQGEPDTVPYGSICSCNPANGGSGICGCVMGNKMIPNPRKYTGGTTTQTTDTANITTDSHYATHLSSFE